VDGVAGLARRRPRAAAVDTTAADLLTCYDTNVFGPVRVTRAFLSLMRRSAAPRIVNGPTGTFVDRTGPLPW
jgi:NAD(P)-dependent dehydrogenase (short-subunit alcohol dehydrogenase family)